MKYYYKALFAREKDGGFTVTFPDVEEVVTYGDTIEEAVEMAKQCLGMCLETREMEGKEFPKATYGDLECEKNCFYMLIEFDLLEYKKKYNAYQKDTSLRWQELETARAFKIDISDIDLVVPTFASFTNNETNDLLSSKPSIRVNIPTSTRVPVYVYIVLGKTAI